MSRTEEFLEFFNKLMDAAPDVAKTASDNILNYIKMLKNKREETERPRFTKNGKIILKHMKSYLDKDSWTAKDIAEDLFISSKTVSGSIRKLCTDNYVEKVGNNPVIYILTTLGKEIDID